MAVIEKGWLGGGNTGRNTTVVRSNYFCPESVALYDLALRLYEGLSRELDFNVMLSQRGILNVSHTPAQLEIAARLANAMQLIPRLADQNPWAHFLRPMDMIRQG